MAAAPAAQMSPCNRNTRWPKICDSQRSSDSPTAVPLTLASGAIVLQLLIPLDVLTQANLERVLRRIIEQPRCLFYAQSSSERHQLVTVDILHLDSGEVLLDDRHDVLDRASSAIRQVEDLIARRWALDGQAYAFDEIVDVREVELLAAVALHPKLGSIEGI